MTINTIRDFQSAIINGSSLIFQEDGTIGVRWDIDKLFRRILGLEQNDNLEIAKYFSRYLKSLEVKNSLFKGGLAHSINSLKEIEETIEIIKERLKDSLQNETQQRSALFNRKEILKQAISPKSQILPRVLSYELTALRKELLEQTQLEPYHKTLSNLQELYLSQKYRSSKDNISNRNDEDEAWLTRRVLEQKLNLFPTSDENLSDEEISKIKQMCSYKEMIDLMRQNPIILSQNLRFIFRDTLGSCSNAVDIAFQYPTIRKRLSISNLDKRVQRLNNEGLKFRGGDVTLLIEGKDISLLDFDKEVQFKSGEVTTLRDVFRAFKEKSKGITNFEYLKEGVSLCRPFETQVDFQKENWWQDLPNFETVTKEELENRYNTSIGSSYTVFTVNVSRSNPNFRIDDNHAWLQIAIPQEDSTFKILPIGKYADVYPVSLFEKLFYIFQTKKAAFSCVDENEFYNNREKTSIPFHLNEDEFSNLMDRIKRDLIETKKGNRIFQAQGENCSAWIQDILDEVFQDIPRLFDIKMLDTLVPWPIKDVVSSLNVIRDNISEEAANITRKALSIILGAWTGLETKNINGETIIKRLSDNEGWQNGYLSLPSFLFKTKVQFKKLLEMK